MQFKIHLTPYHWQPCISHFCDITKGIFCKNSFRLRSAMFDEAVFRRAVVETDSSDTKTETAKFFRDQDRSRFRFWLRNQDWQSSRPRPRARPEKWRHQYFFSFFWKNFLGLMFTYKLLLWLYKLIQMTSCFSWNDYFIKTSRRRHFM